MHQSPGEPSIQRLKPTYFSAAVLLAAVCCFAGTSARAQADPTRAPATAGVATRVWTSPPPGDVSRGAALYQTNCIACHAIDSNQVGPAHRGVMGRRVGSLKGYRYSDELARSRLRWTPQTLNLWLEDPEELVAGQRMGFQVESAQERADLIAYLATLK
jgi:cytochrome c